MCPRCPSPACRTPPGTDTGAANEGAGDATAPTQQPVAPTSAKFSYNVPEGSSVYIEVVQDGKTVEAGDVTGPKTADFDVTGTLKFVLSGDDEDIAAVKLTLDGEEVKAEDQNGRGVYTYTVNFEDVLNDWKRANGVAGASSDSSGDSDSGSSSSSDSSSDDSSTSDRFLRHLPEMATRPTPARTPPTARPSGPIEKGNQPMAKESSFDIVSTVDMQEVDNAFQQAKKELSQRYDLKDSGAEISLDKSAGTLTVTAPAEFVASQVIDVIGSKLIKRGIDLTAVKWGDSTPSSGGGVRRCATVVNGIDKETAGKINKDIKAQKLKCKVTIEGDKLRVSSPSRDTLQEVIAFLRGQDYGQPLQYVNYR